MRGANNTITIWNKYTDLSTNKEVFKRSVVNNCSWETEIIKNVTGNTANVASMITVLVNENKDYKQYKDWLIDKTGFTFSVGDMVALGEISTEITGLGEFAQSKVKLALLPNVFIIKVFVDETETYKRGKHYELSGA